MAASRHLRGWRAQGPTGLSGVVVRVSASKFVVSAVAVALLAGCGSASVENGAAAVPSPTPTPTPVASDLAFASFTFRATDSDGQPIRGSGSFRGGQSRLAKVTMDELHIDGKSERGMSLLLDGDDVFVQMDAVDEMLPPLADRWFTLPPKLTKGAKDDLPWVVTSYEGLADPYQQLQMLRSGDVTTVGPETVDGVATVHQTSTTVWNEIWANPRVSRKAATALVNRDVAVVSAWNNVGRIDAWIDEAGRVVKFEMREPWTATEPKFAATASYDEDASAALVAPERDSVIDYRKWAEFGRVMKRIKAGTATAADLAAARKLGKEFGLDDPKAWSPIRST